LIPLGPLVVLEGLSEHYSVVTDLLPNSGPPSSVNFQEAEALIEEWQATHTPTTTIVLLDQPTIVENVVNQRPVENLVCSPIVRRRAEFSQHIGLDRRCSATEHPFGDSWIVLAALQIP
jgi:hypothetical protein